MIPGPGPGIEDRAGRRRASTGIRVTALAYHLARDSDWDGQGPGLLGFEAQAASDD